MRPSRSTHPTGQLSHSSHRVANTQWLFWKKLFYFIVFPYYPSCFKNFRKCQSVENIKLVQSLNTQCEKQNLYWNPTVHTILCPCFPNITWQSLSIALKILCKDRFKKLHAIPSASPQFSWFLSGGIGHYKMWQWTSVPPPLWPPDCFPRKGLENWNTEQNPSTLRPLTQVAQFIRDPESTGRPCTLPASRTCTENSVPRTWYGIMFLKMSLIGEIIS